MASKNKSSSKTNGRNRKQVRGIRFTQVSPTMLFRTIILFGALIVATVAIINGTTDTNAWAFLGSIVIYAALSNKNNTKA